MLCIIKNQVPPNYPLAHKRNDLDCVLLIGPDHSEGAIATFHQPTGIPLKSSGAVPRDLGRRELGCPLVCLGHDEPHQLLTFLRELCLRRRRQPRER